MSRLDPEIHICDDWIDIALSDWETIIAAQSALSTSKSWTEIVPGLESIAVQFDPALMSPDDAANAARQQLANLTHSMNSTRAMVTIPVCYDPEFAPDRDYIADKIAISPEKLVDWHLSQMQRVSMLGFMPGFAYLESAEDRPVIGRLDSPRQMVAAGSVGIIGRQSCIYSFDSPGGWPIIGRTPLRLFDPSRNQPALLSAGDSVRFKAISREEYEGWQPDPERDP